MPKDMMANQELKTLRGEGLGHPTINSKSAGQQRG